MTTQKNWECFVQKANQHASWTATNYSRICSDHFEITEYIIPPSSSGTCRLKKYAIPSKFNTTYTAPSLPDEQQSRLDISNKRPFPPTNDENLQPPTKVAKPLPAESRDALEQKLTKKIRHLQQQLRRSKQKAKTMEEVIKIMKDKLVISSKEAETLQQNFKNTQLEFLYNFKENLKSSPRGRRYTDEIKEFALTLYFYSPKAYRYVRSIIPLPNPSLIKKWSTSIKCDPGFIEEAFSSLSTQIDCSSVNKDCCLVIDAMSIRKQTLWNPEKDLYSGFVDLGNEIPNIQCDKLATEALVFLLV